MPALPSASQLTDIVAFLAERGVRCSSVDIENEGPTASPVGAYNRAMCYRTNDRTLELLLYRSGEEHTRLQPEMGSYPCPAPASMEPLEGLSLTVAEGENFDIRAADSGPLTPSLLLELNAATEQLAASLGVGVGNVTFGCR